MKYKIIQNIRQNIYSYLSQLINLRNINIRVLQIFFLVITFLVTTFSLISPSLVQFEIDLNENGPWSISRNATEDLIAITDVEFLLEKQYQKAQEEAAKRTPLHITRDFSVLERKAKGNEKGEQGTSFQEMLNQDIRNIRLCRIISKKKEDIIQCSLSKIKRWKSLRADEWQQLLFFSSKNINRRIRQIVNTIFERYAILKEEEKDPLYQDFHGTTIRVHDIKQGIGGDVDLPWKNVITRKQIYTDTRTLTDFKKLLHSLFIDLSLLQQKVFLKLARIYLYRLDACRFDKGKTLEAQEKERSNVSIGDYVLQIKRGETIVRQGDVITENIYEALRIHQSDRWWEILRRFLSISIQQIIFFAFVIYFMLRFSDKRTNEIGTNLVIFTTLWVFSLSLLLIQNLWSDGIKTNEITHFFASWVPIAGFSVLLALIFGERFSIPVVLYMSFLTIVASQYDGISFLISVSTALIGLTLGARIKKRVHFVSVTVGLIILASFFVTVGYLHTNRDILESFNGTLSLTSNYADALRTAALTSLSPLVIVCILPIYETIFNVPTRFKLMELGDPSHPLLRKLFQKAPSTWIHTMMVAALTEKACEKLNLNTILARTGIYFHDIGKMVNAGFFVENQHLIPKPENIDKNDPSQAAKVIISHVLDGIEMAKAAHLPPSVIAFIPEHHGTSTMSFFYHKALQKNRRRVRKEDFQYKGPKPQSKETAIAMLADSLEAASRSLSSYKKESIDSLIQKIINGKILENQFDDCELTIRELRIIKEAFIEVLISSVHSRPKYPDSKETALLEKMRSQKKRKRPSARLIKKKLSKKQITKK